MGYYDETRTALHKYGIAKTIGYGFTELWRRTVKGPILSSYSQAGEDEIIDSLLKIKKGFYIDVGTNHPYRFNNTARFWKKGWTGVNIEPDPQLYSYIASIRNNDTNLNIGIATNKTSLDFYKFNPHTLSTFSLGEKDKYIKDGYELVSTKKIKVMPLSEVVTKYAKGKTVDLLSIDTEGYDYEVLKSIDWKIFRPTVICIESVEHVSGTSGPLQKKQDALLKKNGYSRVYDTSVNSIYKLAL